jgi:hypothetical protein
MTKKKNNMPDRNIRIRRIAIQDLREAALGHLRGEDWDKEMAEALGLLNELDAIAKETIR